MKWNVPESFVGFQRFGISLRLIVAGKRAGLPCGTLIGVPIPKEFAAAGVLVENAIQRALQECSVTGKEVTPFLLKRVNELTQGKSLSSSTAPIFFALLFAQILH
jgi:pseudouridine-5'-phosphate glycosidase/pseudouridine kinase